jgi:hypothetical protein
MKKNYKLQNTNYKQITNYKLQITNISGVLGIYFKLSIVNCQLSIFNEASAYNLLRIPNYKVQNLKSSHGLHKDPIKLQTMTALIKSFCGGGPGGAVFSKSAPPGRRRQE